MKNVILFLALALICGCVRLGVQCHRLSGDQAWVKVTRIGWGVSDRQVECMAKAQREVCGH
jgi:hypothetical protein